MSDIPHGRGRGILGNMKIYFASDHAGFELKGKLVAYANELGHEAEDLGAYELVPGDDYPDYVTPCAEKVAEESVRDAGGVAHVFGVVIGGSGQGEAMCANRVAGVRAAVYYGKSPRKQVDADGNHLGMIESERAHNDANILSLGARFVSEDEAKDALKRFLETPFSNEERHVRRIAKY